MKDLISIIVPVFNAENTIKETIDSILRQSYIFFELILINDGSIDNSEKIITNYTDKRIQYFSNKNMGQSVSSNFGLSKAKGKYIKFFDADDIMNKEHLEAQINVLNGSTNTIASSKWGRFYGEDFNFAKFVPETVWKNMLPLDWLKASLAQRHDMMPLWLWLIPKNILDSVGGWNEGLSLNNDFEFSVRIVLASNEILFAESAKVYYRSGGENSLSSSKSKEKYEAAYLSNALGCSYLLKADNSAEMKLLCANRFQEWVFAIYPNFPEVVQKFESQIKLWGGSSIKMEGGFILKILSNILGWKNAKKVKLILNKLF